MLDSLNKKSSIIIIGVPQKKKVGYNYAINFKPVYALTGEKIPKVSNIFH